MAHVPEDNAHEPDLKQPHLYINRQLSLLEFNRRVLEQAKDRRNPLLERVKFICIASTNLDEFFEVRVAGLKQRLDLGAMQTGPDNMSPQETLRAISRTAHELVRDQYGVLNSELIPDMADAGIRLIRRNEWTREQGEWLGHYFQTEVLPVLSPMCLDPAHPFPRILNKSLNFIVSLHGQDAFGRSSGIAVVQAPRSLPRLIQLPTSTQARDGYDFVFLSSIIHAYVDDLFPGMEVAGCYQFRVTRNSDLYVDEEEVDDLLRALEGELPSRHYGAEVRLEVADDCPEAMIRELADHFELGADDLYQVNGPVNLNRLIAIYDMVDRPDLKYPSFTPGMPTPLGPNVNLFDAIKTGDVLLHHPYQSFLPVTDLLRQAAEDAKVLAIKQTLYRTGPDSAVVDGLVKAAEAGKEVTVVIELRARFDEAENIGLATRLQQGGVHVAYGVVGYKTHAKLILIVRRENDGLRRYCHLGTGNYHPRTARLYTDYGLFTADPVIGEDVHRVFMQLTSLGKSWELTKLLESPFTLHREMLAHIEREIDHARAGRSARIIVKVNSLVERQLIAALYRASIAGVGVDLIVRGMCCLRPGVPGVSDNIRVVSVVGRFLEHTRVYYFDNAGDPEVFCSSADWMERNMFRRVETCFPIEQDALKARLLADLEVYLADTSQAWELQSDGSYRRVDPQGAPPRAAQEQLLARHAESM